MAEPTLFVRAVIASILAAMFFYYYAQQKEWFQGNAVFRVVATFLLLLIIFSSILVMGFLAELATWLTVLLVTISFISALTMQDPGSAWDTLDRTGNIVRISTVMKFFIVIIVIYALGSAFGQALLEAPEKGTPIIREGSVLSGMATSATSAGADASVMGAILFLCVGALAFYFVLRK